VRRPSQWHHVGPDRGLVEENQTLRLDAVLRHCTPALRNVGAIAFAGHHGFFEA
jgi:hypothetical protein